MSEAVAAIIAQLPTLSYDERAALADAFLRSLDAEQEAASREAWVSELARRGEEIRSGTVKGVPAEDVLARLRERYP